MNDVSHEEAVEQHKALSAQYLRNGLGIDLWIEKDVDKNDVSRPGKSQAESGSCQARGSPRAGQQDDRHH